ncbi:uncharacterized protein LOC110680919, partial [Aedes aegypti]|uniref:Uncharacterized protein n=1 Tax=Aedes aegypti TaxID=7159 RepID=A0A903VSH8_AEDAE
MLFNMVIFCSVCSLFHFCNLHTCLGLAEDADDAGKKTTKTKAKKAKKTDADHGPETALGAGASGDNELVEVTKIVSTSIKTPIVHVCFGYIPEDKLDPGLRYVYVIRRFSSPI